MRKLYKSLILFGALLSVTGLSAGITYAAYNAPSDTASYEFGSMETSDHNFQELGYYFGGGLGTSEFPYLIKNSQQLRNLAKLQNSGILPADTYINLGTSFQYEGDAMDPIGTIDNPFTGVFDGLSHVITGLNISSNYNKNNTAYVGMFGVVGSSSATGTVQSFVLAGPRIAYSGSATTVKIGFGAGKKNTSGQTSTVQNIQVYGGTSSFKNIRARITSSVAVTGGDGIVGDGDSATSGFVNVLSGTPSYVSGPKYTSGYSAGTDYYLWYNGSSVESSN